MADINQIITLGIGTPADIEHFILVGLNVETVVAAAPTTISMKGVYTSALTLKGRYRPAVALKGHAEPES